MKKSQSQFMIRSKEGFGTGRPLASLIGELQNKASNTVREIEFAYEKQNYLDQEIQELTKKLNDLRHQKQQQQESQSAVDNSAKEELDLARQRYTRLVHSSNDTQARNGLLRNSLDNLRKERAVLDEVFSKLEKSIRDKEQALMRVLSEQQETKKATKQQTNKLSALKAHLENQKQFFKQDYDHLIQKISQKWTPVDTKMVASTNKKSTVKFEVESMDGLPFTKPGLGASTAEFSTQGAEELLVGGGSLSQRGGHNHSTAFFNNSFAETYDMARSTELANIKNMMHRALVMCQEDDLDYLLLVYNTGEQMNGKLYEKISDTDKLLTAERALREPLEKKLSELEKGLDPQVVEYLEKYSRLSTEYELKQLRLATLQETCKVQQTCNENLDVLVGVLKDCLFIGDKMIPPHWKGLPEERKETLNLIESRSSELEFILKTILAADEDVSPLKSKQPLSSREGKEDLAKIMEVNANLHKKANQDEKDKLILDHLQSVRDKIRSVGIE